MPFHLVWFVLVLLPPESKHVSRDTEQSILIIAQAEFSLENLSWDFMLKNIVLETCS